MGIDVEKYYKRFGPMVLRRCRQILRNEDKALDAMQEVFVRVMRKKDVLRDEYPSSLLYRMATRISLNIIRYEKKRPETLNDELLSTIAFHDDFTDRLHLRSLLDRIFGSQKESTRVIAYLHYVDGLTLEETARETGLSVSGVRKRLRLLALQAREVAV